MRSVFRVLRLDNIVNELKKSPYSPSILVLLDIIPMLMSLRRGLLNIIPMLMILRRGPPFTAYVDELKAWASYYEA